MTHDDDTRGMTIREIVLEIRADLKEHVTDHESGVSRVELFGLLVFLSGLILGIIQLG